MPKDVCVKLTREGLIAIAAFNPFHTALKIIERVQSHISSCLSCRGKYGRYVRERLTKMGYEIGKHETAIIPIFVRDRNKAYGVVKEAYERGLFLSLIEYPAVAPGSERIRLTVMATHTQQDLETAMKMLEELGKKYGVLS